MYISKTPTYDIAVLQQKLGKKLQNSCISKQTRMKIWVSLCSGISRFNFIKQVSFVWKNIFVIK